MATTLSLVVIFVPVAFMTGQIGRYFYSFGITSAAAILISMFVSFTLTPALCAMWLKKEDVKADHSTTKSGGVYAKMDAVYGTMLAWSLHHRAVMMAIAGVVVGLGRLPVPDASARSWCPTTTRASSASTSGCREARAIRAPRSSSSRSRQEILALPFLSRVQQLVGAGQGNFNITMTPLEERKVSQQEMMRRVRDDAAEVPGGRAARQRLRRHRYLRRLDRRRRRRWQAAAAAAAATGCRSSSRDPTSSSCRSTRRS